MVTWSLTISDPPRVVIGAAATRALARRQLAAAANAAIDRMGTESPRYALHLGGTPIGVLQAGTDEHGHPDTAQAHDLLRHLLAPSPNPLGD